VHTTNPVTPAKQDEELIAKQTSKLGNSKEGQRITGIALVPCLHAMKIPVESKDLHILPKESVSVSLAQIIQKTPKNLKSPKNTFHFTDSKRKENLWTIGGQISPQFSYRKLTKKSDQPLANTEKDLAFYEKAEEGLLALSGGVQVNLKVSKRWSAQSGVYYSRIGQVNNDPVTYKYDGNEYYIYSVSSSTGDNVIDIEKIPDQISHIPDTKDSGSISSLMNTKFYQNFEYIEVPFQIKYHILNRRVNLSLCGGFCPAILISNQNYIENQNDKFDVGGISSINKLIYNGLIGVGMEYNLTDKISFNLEPTFKYALQSINSNGNFTYTPYSFALFSGVHYKF